MMYEVGADLERSVGKYNLQASSNNCNQSKYRHVEKVLWLYKYSLRFVLINAVIQI